MTENTLKYAEAKGFKLVTKVNSVNGYKAHLTRENVEIFVESWSEAERWHRASDKQIINEVDNYENLKREQNERDEYLKTLFA